MGRYTKSLKDTKINVSLGLTTRFHAKRGKKFIIKKMECQEAGLNLALGEEVGEKELQSCHIGGQWREQK